MAVQECFEVEFGPEPDQVAIELRPAGARPLCSHRPFETVLNAKLSMSSPGL